MYEVGDSVPLSWRVVNAQQSLVDVPLENVTLTVTPPGGDPTGASVVRDSVGQFSSLYVPETAGRYTLRWQATGSFKASTSDVLNVSPASSPGAIISLAEAREHINIPDGETVEDAELREFIVAASEIVERHTGMVVASRTLVEEHLAVSGQPLRLRPPLLSVTSVLDADDVAVDVDGLTIDGFTGFVSGVPAGLVTVTYEAGMRQIPQSYITATQIICAHLWTTQRANAFTSAPSAFGADVPNAVAGAGYALPNRAAELLGGRAPNIP